MAKTRAEYNDNVEMARHMKYPAILAQACSGVHGKFYAETVTGRSIYFSYASPGTADWVTLHCCTDSGTEFQSYQVQVRHIVLFTMED